MLFPIPALTSAVSSRAGLSESVIFVSYRAEGRQNQVGCSLALAESEVMGCGQAEDKRPEPQVKECSGPAHSPSRNPLGIFSLLKL